MRTSTHRPEDQVVRQYRFLLRTAPLDALQAAHHEALDHLDEGRRGQVLAAVRDGLVAGQRLTPADTGAMARIVSIGERRDPRAFLDACDPVVLHELADAVIGSEAVFGLFSGYAEWDGSEPEPRSDGVDHGGAGARDTQGVGVSTAKELARLHSAQTGVGVGGGGF